MWLFNLLFSSLLTLICRSTGISKCFSDSLGIRDNGSTVLMPSGLFYLDCLESSIANDRGAIFIIIMFYENSCFNANSVDPDQTQRFRLAYIIISNISKH